MAVNAENNNGTYDVTKAQVTQYTYDDFARVTGIASQNSAVEYLYNNDMSLNGITHNGFNYTFGYDAYGNRTSVAITTENSTRQLAGYEYLNNTGLVSKLNYGNGDYVCYTYDNNYRLTGKTTSDGNNVSYKYDAAGNIIRSTQNGIVTDYGYDLIDRPSYVHTNNGLSRNYGYNTNNDIAQITTIVMIILSVSLFCSHTKTATAIGTEHHSSEYVFKIVVRCFVTSVDKLLNGQPITTVNNGLVGVFNHDTLILG